MKNKEYELTDKILTVSNVITLVRILLIPLCIYFMFVTYEFEYDGEIYTLQGQNLYAFLIFIIASASDGLDGWIARKTNTCSKLGKILDPIADRGLIICVAISLTILDRLPLWILILILVRDLLFLCGGAVLLKRYKISIDVIMLGKIATAIMYVGFAMLVLAWPNGYGLGLFNVSWLPGLGTDLCFYGIYFVYVSVILNVFSFISYVKTAWKKLRNLS